MARVLIVEPHPDVRESFAAVCELWHHEVATAADGHEALVLVAAFRPDVVLLDLKLPGGLEGDQVAQRIRRVDGDRVFIIALTGWMPLGGRAKAFRANTNAFLVKPPDLDELKSTIERATDRLATRRWS